MYKYIYLYIKIQDHCKSLPFIDSKIYTKNKSCVRYTCCCSVTQLYLTLQPHGLQHARPLCPSLSSEVHVHYIEVHVHCIGDAIQPSHPLTASSPSALNLS